LDETDTFFLRCVNNLSELVFISVVRAYL